jgi:hypothetical protein
MKRRLSILLVLVALGAATLVIAQGRSQELAEAWDTDEIVTLDGVMTKVDRPYASLQSGVASYVVHLGPLWFWEKAGHEIHVGDRVTIHGQSSRHGDEFHLYPHTIERAGVTIRLADEDGVPVWSGRARADGNAPPPSACRERGDGCCNGHARCAGRHGHRHHGRCRTF